MILDRNGSELTYQGDEGTVSRYHLHIVQPHQGFPANVYDMDILVDSAGDEHPIVVVRHGESTGGIVTNGRAGIGLYEVYNGPREQWIGIYNSPADEKPMTYVPDGIAMHVEPRTIISYIGPRWHRFAQQLDLV